MNERYEDSNVCPGCGGYVMANDAQMLCPTAGTYHLDPGEKDANHGNSSIGCFTILVVAILLAVTALILSKLLS